MHRQHPFASRERPGGTWSLAARDLRIMASQASATLTLTLPLPLTLTPTLTPSRTPARGSTPNPEPNPDPEQDPGAGFDVFAIATLLAAERVRRVCHTRGRTTD